MTWNYWLFSKKCNTKQVQENELLVCLKKFPYIFNTYVLDVLQIVIYLAVKKNIVIVSF